ncbi:glycosyltransferase family 39 protein [Pararhodospirillum photometricum]|uniref:glycosyltransferase family 39 protein n=1 Tax=Pararhodospirillum photometricum TaxID=1084 RepID=UPI0002DFDE7E|nr:glycosyltransferase family 39 protein [Pararhodospirillum photometricum]
MTRGFVSSGGLFQGAAGLVATPVVLALEVGVVLLATGLVFGVVFTGLPRDELESVFWSQTLALGYDPQQPPLHNWLAQGALALFGLGPGSFALIRVLGLGATFLLVWLAARAMARGATLPAGLAVLGLLCSTLFGITAFLNLTHSLVLVAAFAFLLFVLTRFDTPEEGRISPYLLLGIALGGGTLAKYTFVIFAAALLLAAMTHPRLRERLLDFRVVLTLAVAGVIVLPHGLWVLAAERTILDDVPGLVQTHAVSLAGRLWDLLRTGWLDPVAGVALPLLLLGLLVPGVRPGRLPRAGGEDEETCAHWRILLLVYVGLALALVSIVTLIAGGGRLREHYLMPVALVLPVWAALRVAAARPGPRSLDRAAGALMILGALVPLGTLGVAVFVRPLHCDRCLTDLPVAAWVEGIQAEGFTGGTLVAANLDAAANLLGAFPGSRLVWPEAGTRSLAWGGDTPGGERLPDRVGYPVFGPGLGPAASLDNRAS